MIQTEINIDKMINNYESFTSNLLAFIESVTAVLGDKQFVNSLREVQKQLGHFNAYKNAEKPPKFMEKSNLEVLLFTLQSKMSTQDKVPCTPKESKIVRDINLAWESWRRRSTSVSWP